MRDIKNEVGNDKHLQEKVAIKVENVMKQCRKMPNWKVPERDCVQDYWIRNLGNVHERTGIQTNKILMVHDSLLVWMTHGHTVLCCPIIYLLLMWKLLTGVIAEEIHDYLEQEKLLPEEQKGCRRRSRGTKDQLLIDKTVLKDYKKSHTNLSMPWTDYQKAYDIVLHSWINELFELNGVIWNYR